MKVKGWLKLIKELLGEETDDVPEIADETEDGPVVAPETEGLVVGVGLEGKVSFPQRNDGYHCVVDEAGEQLLHLGLDD
jgi:hypothetical protein